MAKRKHRRGRRYGEVSIKRACPPEGKRVCFFPSPASRALYGYRVPQRGICGTVTSLPIPGGRKTCMKGPGGGLVYVKWDDGSVAGVSSYDIDPERRGGSMWKSRAHTARARSAEATVREERGLPSPPFFPQTGPAMLQGFGHGQYRYRHPGASHLKPPPEVEEELRAFYRTEPPRTSEKPKSFHFDPRRPRDPHEQLPGASSKVFWPRLGADESRQRSLATIALEVQRTWPNVNYAARPYLDAMRQLNTVDDKYGYDSGRSVVSYFLSNARTWRGPDAVRLKAELQSLLKR